MENELKKIADHYGYDTQSLQLIEECAELIQAINKHQRASVKLETIDAIKNLAEEIADVEIMIAQIKYLLSIPEREIATIKEYKIYRTLYRMSST